MKYVAKLRSFVGLNPSPYNKKAHPISFNQWKTVGSADTFAEAVEIGEKAKTAPSRGLSQVAIFMSGRKVSDEISGRLVEIKK